VIYSDFSTDSETRVSDFL